VIKGFMQEQRYSLYGGEQVTYCLIFPSCFSHDYDFDDRILDRKKNAGSLDYDEYIEAGYYGFTYALPFEFFR